MNSTAQILRHLIKAFAEATGRATSTISRLSTGSGQTYSRIGLIKKDGRPAHRISTDRVERAIIWIDQNWPDDTEWPEGIHRPSKSEQNKEVA